MVEISVVNADIMNRPCDLLVLKHADGFYGVDEKISQRINFSADVPEGSYAFTRGRGIEARKVLYLGVGPLENFRYEKIRTFGARALEIAANGTGTTQTICSPVHGPGYGLDDKEAFLSLIGGLYDAIESARIPSSLRSIEIVEHNPGRAQRFQRLLDELHNRVRPKTMHGAEGPDTTLSSFGAASERKWKVFVAMPFAEKYSDVWDIAIQEACTASGLVCERIKEQAYVGDILQEIRKRVNSSNGLLALLDGANPNVFLELGYAWALGKPTVLMASSSGKLPFDVQGQKCLMYKSIADLREQLTRELKSLHQQGIFNRK